MARARPDHPQDQTRQEPDRESFKCTGPYLQRRDGRASPYRPNQEYLLQGVRAHFRHDLYRVASRKNHHEKVSALVSDQDKEKG